MATSIVNSWSLLSFAKAHGQLKLATFVNKETGNPFKACAFCSPEGNTLVGFSSNLGELSATEIVARKNELQVVELNSGNYKLCKVGDSADAWVAVDLEL